MEIARCHRMLGNFFRPRGPRARRPGNRQRVVSRQFSLAGLTRETMVLRTLVNLAGISSVDHEHPVYVTSDIRATAAARDGQEIKIP